MLELQEGPWVWVLVSWDPGAAVAWVFCSRELAVRYVAEVLLDADEGPAVWHVSPDNPDYQTAQVPPDEVLTLARMPVWGPADGPADGCCGGLGSTPAA